jgi:nitroreductase
VKTLLSRASSSALGEPGPDDAALRRMFEAAVRAPDHGKLRPWHFYVIRGDARFKLSELFVDALKRREPEAPPAAIEKERGKPLRSPVIIAAVAKILEGHKVPPFEQTLSAAAAVMNILNAAHALGFGAKWVTGANCYDAAFRAEFGLGGSDQLIGFIHLGTPLQEVAAVRPDPGEFYSDWG